MASLLGVELARAGTFDLVIGGRRSFTVEDFADAVAASQDPEFGSPGIRPGHTDPRFDGEPLLGRVANMRVVGDRLVGDLVDLPTWLGDRVGAAYPNRSIEGYINVPGASGREYRLVLTSLALLGVTPPAMRGLADLPAAIAAGAQLIAASSEQMGLADEPVAQPPQAVETPPASSGPVGREGVALDPKELRKSMGLAEDATDAEVLAKAAELAARPEPTAAESTTDNGTGDTATTGTADSGTATNTATGSQETVTTPPATTTPPPGFTLIADGVLDEIKQGAAQGVAAARTLAKQSEDAFIQRHRSRIGPTSNPAATRTEEHLRREWQRNQGEAEAFAASLPQRMPVAAAGVDAAPEGDVTADQFDSIVRTVWPTVAAVRAEREKG